MAATARVQQERPHYREEEQVPSPVFQLLAHSSPGSWGSAPRLSLCFRSLQDDRRLVPRGPCPWFAQGVHVSSSLGKLSACRAAWTLGEAGGLGRGTGLAHALGLLGRAIHDCQETYLPWWPPGPPGSRDHHIHKNPMGALRGTRPSQERWTAAPQYPQHSEGTAHMWAGEARGLGPQQPAFINRYRSWSAERPGLRLPSELLFPMPGWSSGHSAPLPCPNLGAVWELDAGESRRP